MPAFPAYATFRRLDKGQVILIGLAGGICINLNNLAWIPFNCSINLSGQDSGIIRRDCILNTMMETEFKQSLIAFKQR